jgi:hypothetical protein
MITHMTVGYSGTPLPNKLGIKDGHRVAVVAAPDGFALDARLVPLGADMDVILFFVLERRELEHSFDELAALLTPAGSLWISWPKKASGVETDVTESVVREVGLARGLVDTKICAVDETWSGLRFVRRLADR